MTHTAAIEWETLGEVVWVSLLAGVGLTLILCITLVGSIRSADARAHGRHGAAVAFGALAAIGYAGMVGAVIFGLIVMTSK